jgi:ketosteroid isomerase-like protein
MQMLRSLATLIATVVLLALGALGDCSSPKGVGELQDCWQQLWNNNEFDSLMQLYAENATLLRRSGQFVGRTDIQTYWERVRNPAYATFSTSIVPVATVDLGYGSGTFTEDDRLKKNGTVIHHQGGYLVVAQKFKDKWLIVQQAFVVNNLPPANAR